MLSIKEYAEHAGISVQAVYRSLKSDKNKDLLIHHVTEKEGKKYLDSYAIKELDSARRNNPVVIMQESETEKVADLTKQNEQLKQVIMELQNKIIENQDVIQDMQNKLIKAKEAEALLIVRESTVDALNGQIDTLTEQLEAEKNKTWIDKLFKR